MKHNIPTVSLLLIAAGLFIQFILGCNSQSKSNIKFSNTGIAVVLNGRGESDSLKYTCDSCYEILKDKSVLDTVIFISSAEAKDILKNKLSFKPLSVDIRVIKQDSLFYTSGKRIDSLVLVLAKYKCIGKNGYGVEDEVESTSYIYLVGNKVTNLDGKIRKEPLSLLDKNTVSRTLTLYNNDGSLDIQPVLLQGTVHLIVTGNESCVENTSLRIGFSNSEDISLTSWNKFNCNNTSYFKISSSTLENLRTKPIEFVSLSGDDFVFCSVPENQKDYFLQYVSLLGKK